MEMTISLCMIVKNEEDVLGRCLESAKGIVDEIIIVDTGSKDRTKEIAQKYTDCIYDFAWIDDFSAARNFSFQKATKEYIMWLDADDVIEEADREQLFTLKKTTQPDTDIIMLPYHTAFDEWGNVTMSYFRERIIRRGANFSWGEPIHEVIVPSGKIVYGEPAITHRKEKGNEPGRNLAIYRKRIATGSTLSPRGQYYFGRELYYNNLFEEAVPVFTAFLEEGKGWVEDSIAACKLLSACYIALRQMQKGEQVLYQSFCYDLPRGEVLCEIGKVYVDGGQYERAIYWLEQALTAKQGQQGFVYHDYYGYYPHIWLCVCYDKIGNVEKANWHNEQAALLKPGAKEVVHNREYFRKTLGKIPQ